MTTELLSCATCAYHKDKTHVYHGPTNSTTYRWIECRRKPPTVVIIREESSQFWPNVEPDDFCGEWSATFK